MRKNLHCLANWAASCAPPKDKHCSSDRLVVRINAARKVEIDIVIYWITLQSKGLHALITSILHKGLRKFFSDGDHRGIPAQFASRIERILDRLESSLRPDDMNIPGFGFHQLKGKRRDCYAVSVSGNLRITFKFDGENAVEVDLEDYH
jgi:proteic killer suppression protein